ncbi:hypothetical protein GCM10011316_28030 [Roseibium aquae]|uniref:Sulfotransferase family protein n=1 Tax=Roseibium aquae TaxID=1323746 RepID=A0A916X182_9HYPH|nr:hypothetical protein [Roseibium aquae]GGB54375.1 hypothetical protein GCM10011316_28030 [Roseibium aquae]
MLSLVYDALDRQKRPLRHYNFLVFPKAGVAFARIPGAPFRAMLPVLADLADVGSCAAAASADCDKVTALWNGNMEPRTARQLKRLYPDFPVFAVVQSPVERMCSVYQDLFLGPDPLPAFFAEKRFSKQMTPAEFAARVCALPDLRADNRIRTQMAILSYRGRFIPDLVLKLDDLTKEWPQKAKDLQSNGQPLAEKISARPQTQPRPDPELLDIFSSRALQAPIQRRYRADLISFFEPGPNGPTRSQLTTAPSGQLASTHG